MSHAMRRWTVSALAIGAALAAPGARAEEETVLAVAPWEGPVADAATASGSTAEISSIAARAAKPVLGVPALSAQALATRRGGTDVFNDMQLKGVVADNRAINVTTGANQISDGAFAGTSGLPMVVQNTGNNVLIQNATIVNVQVK